MMTTMSAEDSTDSTVNPDDATGGSASMMTTTSAEDSTDSTVNPDDATGSSASMMTTTSADDGTAGTDEDGGGGTEGTTTEADGKASAQSFSIALLTLSASLLILK